MTPEQALVQLQAGKKLKRTDTSEWGSSAFIELAGNSIRLFTGTLYPLSYLEGKTWALYQEPV